MILVNQEIIRIDLGGVNCYLLKEDESFILVDTGGHLTLDKQFDSRREKLIRQMDANGCSAENLKLVLFTHGDSDHTANAAYIKKRYNVALAMHPEDIELVNHPDIDQWMETFRYRSFIYKLVFALMKNNMKRLTLKALEEFEGFKPDILVNEGFDLAPYGFAAKVLHIPGHTKGSIGILTPQNDLIAGDIFSNPGKPAKAMNAADFKVMEASIKRLKKMKIQTVYPGHGEPFAAAEIF